MTDKTDQQKHPGSSAHDRRDPNYAFHRVHEPTRRGSGRASGIWRLPRTLLGFLRRP
jgi:hypothetical protein